MYIWLVHPSWGVSLILYAYLQSDFANNEKFITLFIAKSDGKRKNFPGNYFIFYDYDFH